MAQPYGLGFSIPSTQKRKTEGCIYEATYSRQREGSKLLGLFQNEVEFPPQKQVAPILNSAYWLELEEVAVIGCVLASSVFMGKKRNTFLSPPAKLNPQAELSIRDVFISQSQPGPLCSHRGVASPGLHAIVNSPDCHC